MRTLVAVVAMVAVGLGALGAAGAQEPIKIGVVGPHSGPAAYDGLSTLIGASGLVTPTCPMMASTRCIMSQPPMWPSRPTRELSARRNETPLARNRSAMLGPPSCAKALGSMTDGMNVSSPSRSLMPSATSSAVNRSPFWGALAPYHSR